MGGNLETQPELERFLAGVERRAYRMAEWATGDPDEALDLVQEAMLQLARRYGRRPEAEWPPLFHRILENRIRDWQRRRSARRRWFGWRQRGGGEAGEAEEPLERLPGPAREEPDAAAEREDCGARVVAAVGQLPPRQRQAFLLRAWEGLDTAATAAAMACSEGSVKTHFSRALAALRARLEDCP